MSKIQMHQTCVSNFENWDFGFVSDFDIRISDLAKNLIEISTHLSKEAIQ
jgi:hypothetical protein